MFGVEAEPCDSIRDFDHSTGLRDAQTRFDSYALRPQSSGKRAAHIGVCGQRNDRLQQHPLDGFIGPVFKYVQFVAMHLARIAHERQFADTLANGDRKRHANSDRLLIDRPIVRVLECERRFRHAGSISTWFVSLSVEKNSNVYWRSVLLGGQAIRSNTDRIL